MSKFKIRARMQVRCKGGKCYKKQGAEKVSNSNTSPWMRCEDKNHRLYICRDI